MPDSGNSPALPFRIPGLRQARGILLARSRATKLSAPTRSPSKAYCAAAFGLTVALASLMPAAIADAAIEGNLASASVNGSGGATVGSTSAKPKPKPIGRGGGQRNRRGQLAATHPGQRP